MKTIHFVIRYRCLLCGWRRTIYSLALVATLLLSHDKSTKLASGQLDAISAVMSVVPVAPILTTAGLVGMNFAAISKLLQVLGVDQAYLANGGVSGQSQSSFGGLPDYAYTLPLRIPGLNVKISEKGTFKAQNVNKKPPGYRRKVYPAMIVPADYENQKVAFQGNSDLREIFKGVGLKLNQPYERQRIQKKQKQKQKQQGQQQQQQLVPLTPPQASALMPEPANAVTAAPATVTLPAPALIPVAQQPQLSQAPTLSPTRETLPENQAIQKVAATPRPPELELQPNSKPDFDPHTHNFASRQPMLIPQNLEDRFTDQTHQESLHRPVIPHAFHHFQSQPQPQPMMPPQQPPHAQHISPFSRQPMFPSHHQNRPPMSPQSPQQPFITGSLSTDEEGFVIHNDQDEETHFFEDFDRPSMQRMRRSLATIILHGREMGYTH